MNKGLTVYSRILGKIRNKANTNFKIRVGGNTVGPILMGACAGLFLLAAMTLAPVYNKPVEVEAASSADSMSLTLNTTKANASVDLVVKDSNGTFVSSNSENSNAVFTAATTNYTGYTLNLTGSYEASNTDRAKLYTSNGVSLTSITTTGGVSAENFASSANTNYNGYWGFGYYKGTSGTISTYYPAPSTTATTIGTTTGANSGTSTDTYNIALGARADYSKAAGEYSNSAYSTYSNTYKLAITANAYSYKITYNKGNTTDTVSGLPADSTSTSMTAASFTLPTATPTRTGYTFDGWCSVNPTVSGVNANTCSGDSYAAGATFYFDRTVSNNNITLYAKWKITTYDVSIVRNNVASVTFTTSSSDTTNCSTQSNKTATATLCHGVSYTITMSPSTNYHFSSWSATGGTYSLGSTSSASTTFSMTAAGTKLTANAAINSYEQKVTYYCQTNTGAQGTAYTYTQTVNHGGSFSFTSANATSCYNSSSHSSTLYTSLAGTGTTTINNTNVTGTNSYTVYFHRNSYTITVSNSGTTSGKSSFTVYYGGSNTVTVTPNSGNYLSAVSCPSGFTCTGYNTGSSYTSQQTVTVTHNNATSGGTLSFTGATAKLYMQSMTYSQCTTTAQTVYDNRDETAYVVQRLSDGKCWMLENLAFDAYTNRSKISTSNTNVTGTGSGTGMYYFLNGGGSTSDQYATAAIANNSWPSSYSYSQPMIKVSPSTTDAIWAAGVSTVAGLSKGKIGVYYNYCAATLGSYCYGNGTSYGTSSGNASADYDVCPKGWRMPTGNTSGEYQALYTAYSSNATNYVTALRVPLSGYFNNGSQSSVGSDGYFWSSTRYSNRSMYTLVANTSNVNPANYGYRHYGFSVRCVLKATS